MLKAATALKKAGDLDAAIAKLRAAYKAMGKTNLTYSVQPFLRLPQYLHEAGRNDEAWREYNNLLLGFPNQLPNKEVVPMMHGLIYDKMRLFLQREKKPDKAVLFSMFSYLCRAKGLCLQRRKEDLKEHLRRERIEGAIAAAVKKAKMSASLSAFADILEREVAHLPDIDLRRVEKEFQTIAPGAQ